MENGFCHSSKKKPNDSSKLMVEAAGVEPAYTGSAPGSPGWLENKWKTDALKRGRPSQLRNCEGPHKNIKKGERTLAHAYSCRQEGGVA